VITVIAKPSSQMVFSNQQDKLLVCRRKKLKVSGFIFVPLNDFLSAMDASFQKSARANFFIIFLCLLISWWIYVPVHELFHAFGCVIGGGRVSRLDISSLYGAAFLKRIFPFVSVGSEYAGQLKGFNTFGSDSTYLLTDFFPYVLTIAFGVPLLRSAGSKTASPRLNSAKLGIAIPLAYAPFIAVTGDFYEMGSIIVSRLTAWIFPGFEPFYWRSDDLLKLSGQLFFSGNALHIRDVIGLSASLLLAVVLIFSTYWAGVLFSKLLRIRIHERKV
jgi:hypothetical protein